MTANTAAIGAMAAFDGLVRACKTLRAIYRDEDRMTDAPRPVDGEPAGVFVGPDSPAWQLRVAAPLLDEFTARAADEQLRVQQRRERGAV